MIVNFDDLSARLASNFDQVYVIAGDEPLLVAEASDAIRQRAYQEGFSGRDLHLVERGFDWAEVVAQSSNLSLFDDKRISEIRIPSGKPGRVGSSALVDLCNSLSEDECLVVVLPKLDTNTKKSKWVKTLSDRGVLVQIWPINARQLPQWIAGRLKKVGLNASRDALMMLADRAQGNLLAAQQEVYKLSLLVKDDHIGVEDVAAAVADSARFDVFQLVDAALVSDTQRSMRILDGLRAEGLEATLVLWALTREIRTLAHVCHALNNGTRLDAALSQARVWSTRKALVGRAAQRLAQNNLPTQLLCLAAKTDAAIKGMGPGDPWSGLRSLILGLSESGPVLDVA